VPKRERELMEAEAVRYAEEIEAALVEAGESSAAERGKPAVVVPVPYAAAMRGEMGDEELIKCLLLLLLLLLLSRFEAAA